LEVIYLGINIAKSAALKAAYDRKSSIIVWIWGSH